MWAWILSAMSLTAKLAVGGIAWIIVFAIIAAIMAMIAIFLEHMGVIDL
jgi:hypothetical protein